MQRSNLTHLSQAGGAVASQFNLPDFPPQTLREALEKRKLAQAADDELGGDEYETVYPYTSRTQSAGSLASLEKFDPISLEDLAGLPPRSIGDRARVHAPLPLPGSYVVAGKVVYVSEENLENLGHHHPPQVIGFGRINTPEPGEPQAAGPSNADNVNNFDVAPSTQFEKYTLEVVANMHEAMEHLSAIVESKAAVTKTDLETMFSRVEKFERLSMANTGHLVTHHTRLNDMEEQVDRIGRVIIGYTRLDEPATPRSVLNAQMMERMGNEIENIKGFIGAMKDATLDNRARILKVEAAVDRQQAVIDEEQSKFMDKFDDLEQRLTYLNGDVSIKLKNMSDLLVIAENERQTSAAQARELIDWLSSLTALMVKVGSDHKEKYEKFTTALNASSLVEMALYDAQRTDQAAVEHALFKLIMRKGKPSVGQEGGNGLEQVEAPAVSAASVFPVTQDIPGSTHLDRGRPKPGFCAVM